MHAAGPDPVARLINNSTIHVDATNDIERIDVT